MLNRLLGWLFDEDPRPALSPDLFPRVTLRLWIAARGNFRAARVKAREEARARRQLCLRLSGGQGGSSAEQA